MGCNTEMSVSVAKGFTYKMVAAKCGNTDPQGNEYRCEDCSDTRPWYICSHGQDISEHCCGRCEGEDH
jgi:hypothetical protein